MSGWRRVALVLRAWLFISAAFTSVAACSGDENRHWTEEVRLDDGSVVIVNRSAEYRAWKPKAGGAYGSREIASSISFRDLKALPPWNVPLVPLVLYRDKSNGEWVVVATTNSCEIWAERGSPAHLYWEFRLQEEMWRETPVSPDSFGREANLFVMYEESLPSRQVTQAAKEEIHGRASIAKHYLVILEKSQSFCTPQIN